MGLFQRQSQAGPVVPFYSFGQNRTVLVVGLGNIGQEYDNTRHNIGFSCLDAFVSAQSEMNGWIDKKDLKSYMSTGRLGDTQVICIKPTTFMNLSGEAVQAVCHFYRIPLTDVLVIHDELDLEFGQIRLRVGGGSAGHNGIHSIIELNGGEFPRIRIGIGPKHPDQIDSAAFVLQQFAPHEHAHMKNLYREVTAIIVEYIFGGSLPHETRSFIV